MPEAVRRSGGQAVRVVADTALPPYRPTARRGAENMALDVGLLRAAQLGTASLRLYRWRPCLSFGRNEPALTRYDRARIEQLGLDTVRRPTGGRAVWHDAEVTYAIAAPIAWFGSLRDSYVAIHAVIARALARLDVDATLSPAPSSRLPAPDAGACFASPAGGEIVASGRKLVGSAQVRDGTAFLQHGSILLEDGQDVVSLVTRGSPARLTATSLSAVVGRPVAFQEVADAVGAEVATEWGMEIEDGTGDPPDRALVSHFNDPGWTWRK